MGRGWNLNQKFEDFVPFIVSFLLFHQFMTCHIDFVFFMGKKVLYTRC